MKCCIACGKWLTFLACSGGRLSLSCIASATLIESVCSKSIERRRTSIEASYHGKV